jgi:hypothetical protein
MAKHSEDFAKTTWGKNGGSFSVTSNSIIAPDGNQTADVVTAVTDTPVIQQQIAGLADGGTYTFYVLARVSSSSRKISLAIQQCLRRVLGWAHAGQPDDLLAAPQDRGTLASGSTSSVAPCSKERTSGRRRPYASSIGTALNGAELAGLTG